MADTGQQTLNIQQAIDIAVQHHNAGRLREAEHIYQRILQADPNQPVALHLLGVVAHQVGQHDAAVDLITKALAIEPADADAHYSLALALHSLHRRDEALASYNTAIALKPDNAEAHYNRGIVLQHLGQLDEAVASYHEALSIKPGFAEGWNNLGDTLQTQGHLDEAVASYHKSLAIKPDYAEAHNNLGLAYQGLGKLDDAVAGYRNALAIKPDFASARSNLIFTLNHFPEIGGTEILHEAQQWQDHCAFTGEITEHRNVPDPDRRLRIGLLSGDLRHHSVSYFLENILSEIDKGKLDLIAYATVAKEDDMTARLKAIVPHWRQASGRSDQQLAEEIIADGIDILVDLSGHTGQNRLAVFSRKPAPVQVAWLGYSGTTGVSAMDYILCDRLVLPDFEEADFTETPWRLPDIWVCYSQPGLDIAVSAPPALANGYVTFGSFNNLNKLSGPALACWARILEAVPDSRLLLKARQLENASVQDSIRERFAAHGIDRHRLALKRATPGRLEHLSAYHEMDIALDTFPYAGTTTSVEALWMGVPLMTLAGDRFIGRAGESILRNAGFGDWIGSSPQDYIEKAIAFAADLPALSALREGQRQRLLDSPVCDAARFAGNLENAFRAMWRQWCAKKSV